MDRLNAMTVFVEVAERGSLAAAARALGVTPSAVTRAINGLEQHLGAQLLIRTTRAITLTSAGTGFLDDAKRLLDALSDAELRAAGDHGTIRGRVRVTAPRLFGRAYVVPAVLDFVREHADLDAELICVDHVVDIVREGIDIAVRIGDLPDSALKASRVGQVRRVLVASPDYLEEHGTPTDAAALAEHRVLHAGAAPPRDAPVVWRLGPETEVRVRPRAFLGDPAAALPAALAGHGITRVLSYQAMPHVLAGRLRVVLSDESRSVPVNVVHVHGDQPPLRIERLVAHLRERLRREPLDVPR